MLVDALAADEEDEAHGDEEEPEVEGEKRRKGDLHQRAVHNEGDHDADADLKKGALLAG